MKIMWEKLCTTIFKFLIKLLKLENNEIKTLYQLRCVANLLMLWRVRVSMMRDISNFRDNNNYATTFQNIKRVPNFQVPIFLNRFQFTHINTKSKCEGGKQLRNVLRILIYSLIISTVCCHEARADSLFLAL